MKVKGVKHYSSKVCHYEDGGTVVKVSPGNDYIRGDSKVERLKTAQRVSDALGRQNVEDAYAMNGTKENRERFERSSKGAHMLHGAFMDELKRKSDD